MCGIAGIIHSEGACVAPSWFPRMSEALLKRGPDDFGFLGWHPGIRPTATRDATRLEGSKLAFLHRRLSIIDLTQSGWQPMLSDDGSYSIVFNGEIYNYLELRVELERIGHQFKSKSDTEVLLHAYMEWGSDALNRLIGMFAFAVLDLRNNRVFLARDFFGIKPLYYCFANNVFGFSSEAKTLVDYPGVSRTANPERLFSYLRFGITDNSDGTMWSDIQQLPAAHYMVIDLDDLSVSKPVRYWRIPDYKPLSISYNAAAEQCRYLFLDNIRLHLRSDVPLGTCLSGGIDSSAITMGMRSLLGPGHDIRSFSFIASDEQVCEQHWMDIVSAAAGTASFKIKPSENDLIESLVDLIRSQGEPFGSTSIYAQYKVFELASQNNMKVMLDGQGADEMLGGYWPFLAIRISSLIHQLHWVRAFSMYRMGCQSLEVSPNDLRSLSLGLLLPPSFQNLGRRMISRDLVPPWMNEKWFESKEVNPISPWDTEGFHNLSTSLVNSINSSSLPRLLRYEDRNSMRFSIESRVPFLTTPFVEFALSLPEEYLVDDNGNRKSVFRKAMRGIVPDAILDRKYKIGFATSEENWIKSLSPFVNKILASDTAHSIPALDIDATVAEWNRICEGKNRFGSQTWRWINLIKWVDMFCVTFS